MTFFGTVPLKYSGSMQKFFCVHLHSALRNNLIYKFESYHRELQYIIDLSFIFDKFYSKSAEIPVARSPSHIYCLALKPNICGSALWELLHVTPLKSRILRQFLDFSSGPPVPKKLITENLGISFPLEFDAESVSNRFPTECSHLQGSRPPRRITHLNTGKWNPQQQRW